MQNTAGTNQTSVDGAVCGVIMSPVAFDGDCLVMLATLVEAAESGLRLRGDGAAQRAEAHLGEQEIQIIWPAILSGGIMNNCICDPQ